MEVSKAGFGDVIGRDVALDPSRVAAQVVTGIGFVGAGIIFVEGHSVRGLTTASTAWMAAAIGLACGAGLRILGLVVAVLHVGIVSGPARFERRSQPGELAARFVSADVDTPTRAASTCARAGAAVAEMRSEPTADGVRVDLVLGSADLAAVYGLLAAVPEVQRLGVTLVDGGRRER